MMDDKGLNGKAVTVVKIGRKGALELNHDALATILLANDVKDVPVAVISVTGALRTGKSYLLNFMVRYLSIGQSSENWMDERDTCLEAFSSKGGWESHTKGFVFWSELFKVTIADGSQVAVLLVDTEGTFDPESDLGDNVRIFALSSLISSVQVFNVLRNIQLDTLQSLEMFSEYGRHVQEQMEGVSAFQKLVFLVRDCTFSEEYGWEEGRKFLQRRLGANPSSRNKVGRKIADFYASKECFLMPQPDRKVASAKTFVGSIKDIDATFRANLKRLVEGLLSPENLIVKTIGGQPITCSALCTFIENVTPVFASNAHLDPSSIVDATAKYQWNHAAEQARENYRKIMGEVTSSGKKSCPMDELREHHERFKARAKNQLERSKLLSRDTLLKKTITEVCQRIDEEFENIMKCNCSLLEAEEAKKKVELTKRRAGEAVKAAEEARHSANVEKTRLGQAVKFFENEKAAAEKATKQAEKREREAEDEVRRGKKEKATAEKLRRELEERKKDSDINIQEVVKKLEEATRRSKEAVERWETRESEALEIKEKAETTREKYKTWKFAFEVLREVVLVGGDIAVAILTNR